MKTIILVFTIFFLSVSAFAQKTTTTKPGSTGAIIITVPNFAAPAAKQYYEAYTANLKKAVIAVRNNDEIAFNKVAAQGKLLEKRFQYFTSEPKLSPEDKKKMKGWSKQALPYISEIIQSDFNKKLEREEELKMNK